MTVQVCLGSSCHIKGSYMIIEKLKTALETHALTGEVSLSGSFCLGRCNRVGVTVQVDEDIITGITSDNFNDFFDANILKKLHSVKDDER